MKLLMVTHYFESHQGGIESVAKNIFRGTAGPECQTIWAAAGVSAAPAVPGHGSALPLKTWNSIEGILGLPFPVPSAQALKVLYTAVCASDVVLLHDCLYLSNIAAFLFACVRRVPVIIVQHIGIVPYSNFLIDTLMKVSNALVTRRMLACAQQVVFVSELTKRSFASVRFRRSPALIFNGVDGETFYPPASFASRLEIRDRLGLPRDRPVALFVGRFVEKKGLGVLRHMSLLDPGITWAFAGTGPADPRQWKHDHVNVYAKLRGAHLADLYRASDVFVLPSTGEGFPLVIQEALACGLPVICGADTAGADAALAPFVHGIPLTPGDDRRSAGDFLRTIRDVLAEGFTREASQQRYRFVQTRYSWQSAVHQYVQMIAALACRHPRT